MRSAPLPQIRILWWLKHMDDAPTWRADSGEARWDGDSASYLRTEGLGRPQLPKASVAALLRAGLVEVEDLSLPTNVVPLFPRKDTPQEWKYRAALHNQVGGQFEWTRPPRLLLTAAGAAVAPVEVPYPWVPWLNGRRDITRDESQRQANMARCRAFMERSAARRAAAEGLIAG